MAALPYMQLYPADYLADTMHLTTEEHGAYLLLIFNYWQTGKPIPKDRLARIARLSNERWISVEVSLNEMFNDTGTHWQHKRIEADLLMVKEAQEQRSKAGKASAESRKRKKRQSEKALNKPSSTPVEIPLNENPTNKETETETDTDTELKKHNGDKSPDEKIKAEKLFDQFWQAYPKKSGRADALKKWLQFGYHKQFDLIIADVELKKEHKWNMGGTYGEFRPDPPDGSTYINKKRWEDGYTAPDKKPTQSKRKRPTGTDVGQFDRKSA